MNIKINNRDLFQEYAASIENPYSFSKNKGKMVSYFFFKRLVDILLSIFGLIITAPIIIVTAIFIKIDSPGPIFFEQERVGLNGKYFKIYKIRSMVIDAEKNGAKWASKDDPRITNIGKFIRKTRIDELPQLWNVLKGEMSIIGPRPEIPLFTINFNDEIPGFVNRLTIKPGLTGWAQVNGGYDLTPAEKLEKDLEYINNIGILIDIKIIIKTIFIVFNGNGAR